MAKIICTGCKETFTEMKNPEEAKAYLNEIKLDNICQNEVGLEPTHTCDICGGERFELEPEQTFGLICSKCDREENYFDSKCELGDKCKCGGTMLPCLVNI